MRLHLLAATILICISNVSIASSATAPTNPTSAGSLIQVVFGLAVVLGLMAAVAWAMKHFTAARMSSGAPVKIIGGVAVGNRERIMVVEVADQWIVVGVAPGRVNTLSTMPRQESTGQPAGSSSATGFSSWLKKAADKRNGR